MSFNIYLFCHRFNQFINTMNQKNNYNEKELEKSGNGALFGPDTGKLPLPPMLMVSRIKEIFSTGGKYNKGRVKAELDIN